MAAGVRAGSRLYDELAGAALLRLTLARACAWGLLVAGWVGIGSFALQFAPSVSWGFALVALWLVALGAAAKVATRGGMRRWTRALALCAGAWRAPTSVCGRPCMGAAWAPCCWPSQAGRR